jgi:O-methyltransferase domain/Dimerisation domain
LTNLRRRRVIMESEGRVFARHGRASWQQMPSAQAALSSNSSAGPFGPLWIVGFRIMGMRMKNHQFSRAVPRTIATTSLTRRKPLRADKGSVSGKAAGRLARSLRQPRAVARTSRPPSPATKDLSPERIIQFGLGFMGSKTLLSAVELGLFTELADDSLSLGEVQRRLALHPRSARDFLDALVALGFLERHNGQYSNSSEAALFLDRKKPTYIGGLLEMCNARLYSYWGSFTEALKSGQSQNEMKTGSDLFASLYATPEKLESFLKGMTGISLGAAKAIAEKFPWGKHATFADIGGAQGAVPVQAALAHPHLRGLNYDLPKVGPISSRYLAENGVADRVRFQAGDFFKDPLPRVDVIIMGHILHGWNLEQKRTLIRKVYEALPKSGAFIVYEALIDDDRRENAMGLLMSLNMLIETPGGFDYTGADCQGWMREAGFRRTYVEHLVGPDSMVVGIK